MKTSKINSVKYIIAGIHFILSIFASRFVFKNIGINPSGTKVVEPIISDRAEQVMAFGLTVLFAAVLIYLFWSLVFHIVTHFKKSYILFLSIFVLGAGVLFIIWPEAFTGLDGLCDNLVTYSCAVRLTPDYWHSIYLSTVYGACLLFIPVSFSITLVQWGFFVFTLAYIFERSEKWKTPFRFLILAVFFFPNALEIISYSHRMCMYVIILSLYASVIIFDIIERRKRNLISYILLAALGAFLSVWRSEGIIVGFLLLVLHFIVTGEKKFKAAALRIIVFGVLFVAFSVPQKIGDRKYYGNDYSIINTFETLYYIFNSPDADLEYEGAAKDLETLSEVVPVEYIKEYATEGYRRYNYSIRGNGDINQSTVSADAGKAYMGAYRRIVLHNPVLFIKKRINNAADAAGLKVGFEKVSYQGEHRELANWSYSGWTNGYEDYYSNSFLVKWRETPLRHRAGSKFLRIRSGYLNFVRDKQIYGVLLILLAVADLYIMIRGITEYVSGRDRRILPLGWAGIIVLLGFAGIVATMPVAGYIYYFSSAYLMALIVYVYILLRSKSHE